MTVLAGIVAFWALTDFPATAGWLTEEEKACGFKARLTLPPPSLTSFFTAGVIWRKAADGSSVGEAEHITWP